MEDKFLVRVDEEMPSDERMAIKIIETGVGHEIKEKVDLLLERMDSMGAVNNIEILREMKDILSGLLESITSVSQKYSFISEMILKMDEKIQRAEKVDLSYIENGIRGTGDRLDQMTEGLSKLLADLQVTVTEFNANFALITQSTDMKISDLKSDIGEVASRLGETISASYSNSLEATAKLNDKIDTSYMTAMDLIEKINQRIDATYMSGSEMAQRINEMHVKNNEAFSGFEGKLININSQINTRIDELSVSNAELIERGRALSSDMSSVMEKLNEKIGEMSVIGAELADKIMSIRAEYDEKSRVVDDRFNGLQSDIVQLSEKISNTSIDRAELMGRLDEISSGTAALINGVEEKMKNLLINEEIIRRIEERIENSNTFNSGKISEVENKIEDMIRQNIESISRLEEKVGSTAANDMDVLARVDEKLSDMNARNGQLSEKMGEIERIDRKIDLIQDETRSSVARLIDELKKYQEDIKVLVKPKRIKPRKGKKSTRGKTIRRRTMARPTRTNRQIEDEALDILILNTLKNVSMSMDSLSRATEVNETRLRKRLTVLMTRGVVVREKRGRLIFYVSRVDETVSSGS